MKYVPHLIIVIVTAALVNLIIQMVQVGRARQAGNLEAQIRSNQFVLEHNWERIRSNDITISNLQAEIDANNELLKAINVSLASNSVKLEAAIQKLRFLIQSDWPYDGAILNTGQWSHVPFFITNVIMTNLAVTNIEVYK